MFQTWLGGIFCESGYIIWTLDEDLSCAWRYVKVNLHSYLYSSQSVVVCMCSYQYQVLPKSVQKQATTKAHH